MGSFSDAAGQHGFLKDGSQIEEEFGGPSVSLAFHTGCVPGCTTCSCTSTSNYWSSSSIVGDPADAWFVDFSSGTVNRDGKNQAKAIRSAPPAPPR